MNLAQSLLAACERFPAHEAFPGITYEQLLPRVQRIAGGLAVEPGEHVALVLDNRLETALCYWAAQWAGAIAVPLSWRMSDDELAYCLSDCAATRTIRDGDPLPDGPEHPGALDRDDREVLLLSRFQELSFAEIATMLECSVGAAKVRAHRALRELRDIYFQLQKENLP